MKGEIFHVLRCTKHANKGYVLHGKKKKKH